MTRPRSRSIGRLCRQIGARVAKAAPLVRARLLALACAAIALAAPAAASAQAPSAQKLLPPPASVIGIVSGGVDGTYIRIAADLAAVLDGPQLRIVPIVGRGSLQNIDDVLHLRGVDIGIVQSDVLAYIRQNRILPGAERGIGYIAKLYDEEVHVLARPGIAGIEELAGKTVNFDVPGSGTALTASILFDKLGIKVQPAYQDQASALNALRQGTLDALVYVAGKPARLFSAIPPGAGLRLLPVPTTSPLLEAYLPSKFSHDDYPALVPEDAPVETVAVGAVLAVFQWPQNTERYRNDARFVEGFFGSLAQLRQPPHHPKWREVNLGAQVPGWTRFPPAVEWLKRRAANASPKP